MSLLLRHARREMRFPWRRLWAPRGSATDTDAVGFLAEPGATLFFRPQNTHLRTFDELDMIPCLLALGDPGLGKSWEIEGYTDRLARRLEAARAETGAHASAREVLLAFDAKDFDSREALRERVFEDSVFAAWRVGTGTLHLVLDSLDESLIPVELLCDVLLNELETLPIERLRLRIACRTAILPPEFSDGLRRRFTAAYPTVERDRASDADETGPPSARDVVTAKEEGPTAPVGAFAEVEIALLTRTDARAAAAALLESDAAAEGFLQAVEATGAGAFAARPQTLLALVSRFAGGQPLAASQLELFRDLCLRLCDPKPVRPGTRDLAPRRTSREERYRLAGRISAAMLLGNRPALWLGYTAPAGEAVLDLADLTGSEYVSGVQVRADETALWEAVNTALFTGVGESGLAAHQTFAEFMAAEWLTGREMPLAQMLALFTDPADEERRIVPQLRQIASWLAAMREDVFDTVARTEPDIVLWSDVVQLPEAKRPELVRSLLDGTTANRIQNPLFGMWRRLERLAHAGLAEQLAPVIANRSLPDRTRDLALSIAHACTLAAVAPAAARLALDHREPIDLRTAAAHVVAESGSENDRRRIIPLVTTPPAADEVDDLKGAALSACWKLLTPDELFAVLTPPKRPNYGGSYGSALREIADGLSSNYARAGAAWLATGDHDGIYLDRIGARTFRLALDASEDPFVLSTIAKYILERLRHHRKLLEDERAAEEHGVIGELEGNIVLRRRLLTAIIDAGVGNTRELLYITYYRPQLLAQEDIPWALDQLTTLRADDPRRAAWRDLTRRGFDPSCEAHVVAAFAHRDDPDTAVVSWDLTTKYTTPQAALAAAAAERDRYRKQEARRERVRLAAERKREAQRVADAAGPLAPRLGQALTVAGGAEARWHAVLTELLRVERKRFRGSLDVETLTALRVLRGTEIGEGVVAAAADYLRDAEVPENPFPNGTSTWLVTFGFVATVCLLELAPEQLEKVSADTWTKWFRALVGYTAWTAEEGTHAVVLRRAASVVPDIARMEFLNVVDRIVCTDHGLLRDSVFDVAVDVPGFAAELAERIVRSDYGAVPTARVLDLLLGRDATYGYGLNAARALFKRLGDASAGAVRERGLAAGAALLARALAKVWEDLWTYLAASDTDARALLEHAAGTGGPVPHAALDALTDEQVADLYLLVARLYPPETDPWHIGVFSPGSRDNLQLWRGSLVRTLEARKTETAVAQLERIARQEPVRDYLVQTWLQAKAALRGDRWRGTAPQEIMRLAERPNLRLVESGTKLLDVLMESLARFEDELQGQWRGVAGLWNESADGNRPKPEEHLSNEIARHLQRDLADRQIVIGRELVLQIGVLGGADGLRTDIDVVANASPGTNRTIEQVRAVIEVKGSWNVEVPIAMQSQLVEKYLDPHRIRHGLYLVGDYTCESWRNGAQRRQSLRYGGKSALTEVLCTQARNLTTPIREVRAVVLNTALPDAARTLPRRPRRKAKTGTVRLAPKRAAEQTATTRSLTHSGKSARSPAPRHGSGPHGRSASSAKQTSRATRTSKSTPMPLPKQSKRKSAKKKPRKG